MSDDIHARAQPIAHTGEAEWLPATEDDASPPPHEQSLLRRTFYGRDGLRAGWSVVLFIAMFIGASRLFSIVIRGTRWMAYRPQPGTPAHPLAVLIFSHGIPFLVTLALAWIMSRTEHRRMRQYYLGPIRWRQLLTGSAWGFALFSMLIALLRATHVLIFTEVSVPRFIVGYLGMPRAYNNATLRTADGDLTWGLIWFITFFSVALFEEYLTRGYLQFTLARGVAGIARLFNATERTARIVGFWIAAVFFAFLFGLGHTANPGESPIGIWAAGLIGLVFAFSVWRTGSLWWAVGWHAMWDWAESFIYGTADSGNAIQHSLVVAHPQGNTLLSGGLTGPEGSVLVLPIIALTAVVIAVTLKSQPGSPSSEAYSPNTNKS